MSKYYETLSIGALTGFIQAPHPDARMVIGEKDGRNEHAGWLMPQVGEVDEKTARYERDKRRRAARAAAALIAERFRASRPQ
jgi:hypothetical protein